MKRNGKEIRWCGLDDNNNIVFTNMEGDDCFIDCEGCEQPIDRIDECSAEGFASDGLMYWWKADVEAYLANELGFDEEAIFEIMGDCYGANDTFMVEDYLIKHHEASASDLDENGYIKRK
ncbi:MAG: hypothetical protein ACI4TD_00665 [Phocaeicola sp.]